MFILLLFSPSLFSLNESVVLKILYAEAFRVFQILFILTFINQIVIITEKTMYRFNWHTNYKHNF